jgi:hypothetical protein
MAAYEFKAVPIDKEDELILSGAPLVAEDATDDLVPKEDVW